MLLHRTNSRRKSTPGARWRSAHHSIQSGHDDWDQNDFRCIHVPPYLSDHFVRTFPVMVALGRWLAVGAADPSLRFAESLPAAVAGLWLVAARFVLGSSPVAPASVPSLPVAASPVSPV